MSHDLRKGIKNWEIIFVTIKDNLTFKDKIFESLEYKFDWFKILFNLCQTIECFIFKGKWSSTTRPGRRGRPPWDNWSSSLSFKVIDDNF